MNAAVRYYSRGGNSKAIAEAVAKAAGVQAISVDQADAQLAEETDVLFIGGALYAYGLDSNLTAYLEGLDGSKVKKAVIFSTSWLSKHSIDLIRAGLQAKGIPVVEDSFYVRGKPSEKKLADAAVFAGKYL